MIEPVVTFNSRSKYYSNANSISLKLLAEIKRKSMDWYLELKRIMTFATKLSERPQALLESYSRTTQYMSSMVAEDLPIMRENQEGRFGRLQQFLNEAAADIISVKELKLLASVDQENQAVGSPSPTPMSPPIHGTRYNMQQLIQPSLGSQKDLLGQLNGGTKITAKPTIRY